MKKILSIFLVLSMLAASMAACSGDTTSEDTTADTSAPAVEDTTPAAEETEPAAEETEPAAEETKAPETEAPVVDAAPEKEGYSIEQMDTWYWMAHECPYYGYNDEEKAEHPGFVGEYPADTDEMAKWIAANPTWYADYEMMSKWETAMGPFGDVIDSFIAAETPFNDPDPEVKATYHGLTVYKSFEVTELDADSLYELWMVYDNTVYVYVNGKPYYIHDNNLSGASDWTGSAYVQILPNQEGGDALKDWLVEGTNHIAVSIKDAWGGRDFDGYIWYQLDSTKRDVFLKETNTEWNAIALSAPYVDGDGNAEGGAAGGNFPEDTDEFKKYITEHPDFTTDYATASSWPVYTAVLNDGTPDLGWVGPVHGLIAHSTFTVENLEDLKTCDEWRLYGSYDNAVHFYLNGVEIYEQDGECVTQDWASGEWVLDEAVVEGAIKEGENHIVVTIKDAWGGRNMNLGLYCHWN